MTDLSNLFTPAGLLHDENEDGIPDAVRGRLVFRAGAPAAVYVAGAAIAARLGLETTGLTLPVAQSEITVPAGLVPLYIDIGLLPAGEDNLFPAALAASEGLIQVRPGEKTGQPAVWVTAADAAGLLAAARWLALRSPYVWHVDPAAPTLGGVRQHVVDFLTEAGIQATETVVVGARLSRSPGVHTLYLNLQMEEQPLPVPFEELPAYLAAIGRPVPPFAGIQHLRLRLYRGSAALTVDWPGASTPPASPATAAAGPPEPAPIYDLENLYTIHGLLTDADGDLRSDGTRCTLILAEQCTAAEGMALVNLAARLGLEAGGISWPLAVLDSELAGLAEVVHPVLLGAANRFRSRLAGPRPALAPRQGALVLVPDAETGNETLLVDGADAAGATAAAACLAENLPALIHPAGLSLLTIKDAVADFLALRDPGAQAAALVAQLRALASDDPETPVRILLPAKLDPLHAFLQTPSTVPRPVAVQPLPPVLEQRWQIPWEVDHFWALWRERIQPHLRAGDRLVLDLRLSESRAVRQALRRQLQQMLAEKGIQSGDAVLQVRSAYKQGLCWLVEEVLPALRAVGPIAEITIFFTPFHSPQGPDVLPPGVIRELRMVNPKRARELEEQQKQLAGAAPPWHELPIRWLQDLYPADELLARELGIAPEQVAFVAEEMGTTYRVVVTALDGRMLYADQFTCTFAGRPYLTPLPHLGVVHPPTGWLRVTRNGQALVDQRIPTDLEQFWERYQADFLPALGEQMQDRSPATGPLFSKLTFEVALSEADERLGLREELFSPLEALHEDLYFVTLKYAEALDSDAVLGQIVPRIRQREGQAGQARITVLPLQRPVMTVETDPPQTLAPQPLAVRAVRATGVVVEAGHPAVHQVRLEVTLDAGLDQAVARLEALPTLWEAGLYRDTLAWPEVEELVIRIHAEDKTVQVCLPRPPDVSVLADDPLVQETVPWDRVIGLQEEAAIVRGLGRRPEIRAWQAGCSFERRPIFALDVTAPASATLRPRAKASLFKPTFLLKARYHGNEPSATNAALRLADLLSSDPDIWALLKRVNVSIIPTENVDGAALAYELQQAHSHWMLHAGRYNALGETFHREYLNEDTLHREALALPRVWQAWLPDILVDDHGFPSHEWMQPFSGGYSSDYAAYWLPRALFYGYLPYVDDDAYPNSRRLAGHVRQATSQALNEDAEIRAWNTAWARVYEKYLHQWLPEIFPLTLHEDVVLYFYPVPANPAGSFRERGASFATCFPQVTAVSWITEVADETAQGPYMALAARSHLLVNLATLRRLAQSTVRIERRLHETPAGLTLSLQRTLTIPD